MARLDGQRFSSLALNILATLREGRFTNEDYIDAFIRLLGLTPNTTDIQAQLLSADQSLRTLEKSGNQPGGDTAGHDGSTLVDGLLKSTRTDYQQLRTLCASYLDTLLQFIERWSRVQRGQQTRRLQRLVGDNSGVSDSVYSASSGILSSAALFETDEGANTLRGTALNIEEIAQRVNDSLKKIQESGVQPLKPIGELTLQLSVFEAISTQLDSIISVVPVSKLGELGGDFIAAIKASLLSISQQTEKLGTQRLSVLNELSRLNEQSALINDGVALETGEKLSLRNFIQGLRFLCKDTEYKCKNCKYFMESGQITDTLGIDRESPERGAICTYSFHEGRGKATTPEKSCFEVWGKAGNDYWTASMKLIDKFKEEFLKQVEA